MSPFFTIKKSKYFMKHFILVICTLIFLTACSDAVPIPVLRGEIPIRVSSDNPALTAYNYYGLDERNDRQELKDYTGVDPVRTEWCAAFVNSVLNESGILGSESVSDVPLMARSFLKWGQPVIKEDIQPGDLVIFPRGNQGWQGHVGFYLQTLVKDGIEYYLILGGNQSNKVSIELFRASKALDIRRKII
jgi:uncharacterized protein (TIGR02594 family)